MARVSDRNLTPRNGHTLMSGLGARISGCADQKKESLEDQTDHNKEVVADLYTGPTEYLIIATKGKGERLDRPELAQIEAEFRKGYLDLFVWEDLGRPLRSVEAVRLLGSAVDHGVRVIVPNDNIDTANDIWEADAIKACTDHVAHKLANRFLKNGGATAQPIADYLVPDDAETYDDRLKDPRLDVKSNTSRLRRWTTSPNSQREPTSYPARSCRVGTRYHAGRDVDSGIEPKPGSTRRPSKR